MKLSLSYIIHSRLLEIISYYPEGFIFSIIFLTDILKIRIFVSALDWLCTFTIATHFNRWQSQSYHSCENNLTVVRGIGRVPGGSGNPLIVVLHMIAPLNLSMLTVKRILASSYSFHHSIPVFHSTIPFH